MKTLNDSNSTKFKKIIPFLVYALCFAVPNYGQYQVSALGPEIMGLFDLDFVKFNSMFTAPMLPAIFTSLIGGLLVDRFGYKPVIAVSIVLTVIGCWLRLVANSYAMLFISMVLLGVSAGFTTSNSSKALSVIYGPEKVSILAGLMLSISTCTLVLSMSTTVLLGMTRAFFITAVAASVGLVCWIAFMPHVKDAKPLAQPEVPAAEESAPGMGAALKTVLRNKYVWFAGLAAFCIQGAMAATGSMVPAALQAYGSSAEVAGVVASLMMVGNLLGSLIIPTVTQKTGKFRAVMMLCGLVSVLGSAFAWRLPVGLPLYIGMILTGFAYGSGMSQIVAVYVRLPNVGFKYAGTAGGLGATLMLLGGVCLSTYIASPIAGDSYPIYFIVIGASSLLWILSVYLLPKSLDVKG